MRKLIVAASLAVVAAVVLVVGVGCPPPASGTSGPRTTPMMTEPPPAEPTADVAPRAEAPTTEPEPSPQGTTRSSGGKLDGRYVYVRPNPGPGWGGDSKEKIYEYVFKPDGTFRDPMGISGEYELQGNEVRLTTNDLPPGRSKGTIQGDTLTFAKDDLPYGLAMEVDVFKLEMPVFKKE